MDKIVEDKLSEILCQQRIVEQIVVVPVLRFWEKLRSLSRSPSLECVLERFGERIDDEPGTSDFGRDHLAGEGDKCNSGHSSNRGCASSTNCENNCRGFRQGPERVNF